MPKSSPEILTTPPYRHLELASITTVKMLEEMCYRLKVEPTHTYEIWPDGFDHLHSLIVDARSTHDN
jgi:hypothetical protein